MTTKYVRTELTDDDMWYYRRLGISDPIKMMHRKKKDLREGEYDR